MVIGGSQAKSPLDDFCKVPEPMPASPAGPPPVDVTAVELLAFAEKGNAEQFVMSVNKVSSVLLDAVNKCGFALDGMEKEGYVGKRGKNMGEMIRGICEAASGEGKFAERARAERARAERHVLCSMQAAFGPTPLFTL